MSVRARYFAVCKFRFPYRGAWLFNYGLQIHLIESENQTPPNTEIQARVDHIAFRVSDIDTVKRLLDEGGIEYASRHVPDTGVTQVFFLDPDGNHIECGMSVVATMLYGSPRHSRQHKQNQMKGYI